MGFLPLFPVKALRCILLDIYLSFTFKRQPNHKIFKCIAQIFNFLGFTFVSQGQQQNGKNTTGALNYLLSKTLFFFLHDSNSTLCFLYKRDDF